MCVLQGLRAGHHVWLQRFTTMSPDVYTFILLFFLAHTNDSHIQETTNSTVAAVDRQYHGGQGRGRYPECEGEDDCGPGQDCIYGRCRCSRDFYFDEGSCKRCPGYNEYCGYAQCCSDSAFYYCGGDHCRCKLPDADGCREPSNNIGSMQMITAFQVILASAFSIAFFALVIQCWRTCCRKKLLSNQRPAMRDCSSSSSSRPSVTDQERLAVPCVPLEVSTLTRDAPPRYDDLNHIQFEKPPPYQQVVDASPYVQMQRQSEDTLPHLRATAPMDDSSRGVENAAFVVDDCRDPTAPPRVSFMSGSLQAVPEGRESSVDQHTFNHVVVDVDSGGSVVIPPADVVHLQSTAHPGGRNEQVNLPPTPAASIVICQVHRTESSI